MGKRNQKNKDRLTQEDILVIERTVRRELAKEAGFYDGRNRPAVYVDRKKKASKKACRGRVDY